MLFSFVLFCDAWFVLISKDFPPSMIPVELGVCKTLFVTVFGLHLTFKGIFFFEIADSTFELSIIMCPAELFFLNSILLILLYL